jgi:hypothetical protein
VATVGVEIIILRVVAAEIGRLSPELRSAQTEPRAFGGLVPEHLILQLVGLGVVVDHQTLIVLRALVHDLTERVEVGEHASVLFVEFSTVADDGLTEEEYIVDVRTQIRRDTDGVLHRDDKHRMDVAPVHEQIPDVLVADPAGIVQTVVQDQEVPWIHGSCPARRQITSDLLRDELLTFENIGDDEGGILLVDEHGWHHLAVELVGTFRTGDHRAAGQALVVPEQILHKERLTGLALADEHHHLVVFDLGHVELLQTQIQLLGRGLCHAWIQSIFFQADSDSLTGGAVFRHLRIHRDPTDMKTLPADLRLFYRQRAAVPALPGCPEPQTYFPSLEVLFPSLVDEIGTPALGSAEAAITVDPTGTTATVEHALNKVKRADVPIWIRAMHLVEPVDVLSGEYVLPRDGALPASRGPWQRSLRKLNDPYNEAYTDAVMACMASRLVETKRSPHFCRFFGTFSGRVPEYKYNITDDMADIEGEAWFREGLKNGAFQLVAVDPWDPTVTANVTRPWEDARAKLDAVLDARTESESGADEQTPSVTSATDDEESESEVSDSEDEESETEDEEDESLEEADIDAEGTAVVHRPRLQLSRISGSVDHEEDDDDSSDSDDVEYRAILKDFPVQLTVLERCDGTMDDLMEEEISDESAANPDMQESKESRWTAWMFQVVAGLTTAQQIYDFVHNDLHTNNVMWSGTGETHLYYHITGAPGGDRYYRVPTYGRIMKIIDFGRATFRPAAAATANRLWLPDAYAPDADAGGQYNCGAYHRAGEPKVLPNKSFDLCRLAVAILDTLWPEVPATRQGQKVLTREPGRVQHETESPLWNLLWLWLTDKHGKNVLFSPDGSERYPNFNLYCAIARDAQNAVPAQQLTLPLFDSVFRCRRRDIPDDACIYRLQAHK